MNLQLTSLIKRELSAVMEQIYVLGDMIKIIPAKTIPIPARTPAPIIDSYQINHRGLTQRFMGLRTLKK